jgi:hypothetical protein
MLDRSTTPAAAAALTLYRQVVDLAAAAARLKAAAEQLLLTAAAEPAPPIGSSPAIAAEPQRRTPGRAASRGRTSTAASQPGIAVARESAAVQQVVGEKVVRAAAPTRSAARVARAARKPLDVASVNRLLEQARLDDRGRGR